MSDCRKPALNRPDKIDDKKLFCRPALNIVSFDVKSECLPDQFSIVDFYKHVPIVFLIAGLHGERMYLFIPRRDDISKFSRVSTVIPRRRCNVFLFVIVTLIGLSLCVNIAGVKIAEDFSSTDYQSNQAGDRTGSARVYRNLTM